MSGKLTSDGSEIIFNKNEPAYKMVGTNIYILVNDVWKLHKSFGTYKNTITYFNGLLENRDRKP